MSSLMPALTGVSSDSMDERGEERDLMKISLTKIKDENPVF